MGPTRQQLARGIGLGGAAVALGAAMVPLGQLVSPAAPRTVTPASRRSPRRSSWPLSQAYMAAAESGKVTTTAVLEAATAFAGHHTGARRRLRRRGRLGRPTSANPKLLHGVGRRS